MLAPTRVRNEWAAILAALVVLEVSPPRGVPSGGQIVLFLKKVGRRAPENQARSAESDYSLQASRLTSHAPPFYQRISRGLLDRN